MRRADWRTWLIVALAVAGASPAWADEFDYDPQRAAALRSCDAQREQGRATQSRGCYQALLNTSRDPLIRAEASWSLGDVRTANEQFRAATVADARALRPRLRWSRLYLSTHQYADAQKLIAEALAIAPQDRQARLALLTLTAARFDGDADKAVRTLLEEDDTLIGAHLLAGRLALEDGDLAAATTSAEAALAQTQKQQRAPLEAYALRAAIEVVANRSPDRWTQAALGYNPKYGDVFATLAHYEVMRRRYREAAVWLARAVETQPDLWSAQEELGVNALRLGDRATARTHLQLAYKGDPYSATTVNTLRLLDSLPQYEFIEVADPALILQLHRSESAALRPYVEQLSRQSIGTFSARYGYKPAAPVTVEFYPHHDDFAVRTAGLPGIGLLGVTFGHLVAMDSPSGRQSGEFHWGSTLWHEMAHVFTLSATDHHVPRWLSEGISVFEEWRTGPTPGVSVSPSILDAYAADKFLSVAKLDEGFIRPAYENQVQVSYMQAGLTCLFIEQRWGFESLVTFLKKFDGNTTTEAAVLATFKLAAVDFDREFNLFFAQRFAPYLKDPKAWTAAMKQAAAAVQKHDWAAARPAAEEAVRLLPEYTAAGSAYQLLAAALAGAQDKPGTLAALLAYRAAGGWDPEELRRLATLLDEAGRMAEATTVLEAVNLVDPLQAPGHAQLGEKLLAAQRAADARREFDVLLALQPEDTVVAQYGLARAAQQSGDAAGTRRHLLQALETAPHYRPAQNLLLELNGESRQ